MTVIWGQIYAILFANKTFIKDGTDIKFHLILEMLKTHWTENLHTCSWFAMEFKKNNNIFWNDVKICKNGRRKGHWQS